MTDSVKRNLLAAFRYLLKPLVRLALKNGVLFAEFSEALKEAYVDVAAVQIKASEHELTKERISLMTGIASVDVDGTLRSQTGADFAAAAQREQPLPNLLTAWHTHPMYAGPYGVCRDLKFDPEQEGSDEQEFVALATETCPGVPPNIVLAELLRTGCVISVGGGFYRVAKRFFVPESLSATSILLFAQVVHNFCETAEMNLRSSNQHPVMQRIIFTRYGITKSELEEFDRFIRVRGQFFADEVDNWLSERDSNQLDNTHINTGVGFYHYIVNEDDELALSRKLPN